MTSRERQFVLFVVESLCEGLATQKDLEKLESIVLKDRDARRLYIEALDLHGMLYWDAAGAGSTEMPVYRPPQESQATTPATKKNRVPSNPYVYVVGVGLLMGCITYCTWILNKSSDQVVRQQSNPPQHVVDVKPESQLIPAARENVPEISLPQLTRMQPAPVVLEDFDSESDFDMSMDMVSIEPTASEILSDTEIIEFINRELALTLQAVKVPTNPIAADSVWVRRVYLDIAGRIPTLAETETFLASSAENKRAELIERLLSTPEYARNQASIWTNLLVGRAVNQEIRRQSLQAWLARQFRENRPWRDTVEELIAAEGTPEHGPSNFLLAHLNNQAVPATSIAARILLCQQLHCAQCHDHPQIKEWNQAKFWELNSFFQQAKIRRSEKFDPAKNRMTVRNELVNVGTFGPTYFESTKGVMFVAYPKYSETELLTKPRQPLREQLAKLLFSDERPQTARAFVNRVWAQMLGYGFTNPIDDMGPHVPVSHPELLERLTREFVKHNYDVKRLIRWISRSDVYQLSSEFPEIENADSPELGDPAYFSRVYVKSLTPEQIYDSLVIATSGDSKALFDRKNEADRDNWLARFFTSDDNEENSELSTFDGTLTQALTMMNGELVHKATDPKASKVLKEVIENRNLSDIEKIQRLSLAALSRPSQGSELNSVRESLRRTVRSRADKNTTPAVATTEALRDLYWAYLNSSEFTLIQ